MIRQLTKQSAQGCGGKVIRPYTINNSRASRHHTDSLGASTAREKVFGSRSSSASRLLSRYLKCIPPTSPGAPAAGRNMGALRR